MKTQPKMYENRWLQATIATWWRRQVDKKTLFWCPLACSRRLQYPSHGDSWKAPFLCSLVLGAFRALQHQMGAGLHAFFVIGQAYKIILDPVLAR